MMRQMLIERRPRPVVFLNGVPYADELGYRTVLDELEGSGTYPVTYVPTVSRPDDPRNKEWAGRTGRVRHTPGPGLDELGLWRPDSIAYICASPVMILAAEATLLERGYPEDQVHKEPYW